MSTTLKLDDFPAVAVARDDAGRLCATLTVHGVAIPEDGTTREAGKAATAAALAAYRAAAMLVVPVVKLDWSLLFGVGTTVLDSYGTAYVCTKRRLAEGDDSLTFRAPDGAETTVDLDEALELVESGAWRLP
jgi:hypothetical protein